MKLSFCTTSMNRLSQLQQTLPENLAILEGTSAELVLVNYNSSDQLDDMIRSHFMAAIDKGTLRYIHEKSVIFFHASKAKNLAHRLAAGDFLFNLDGDNFIGPCLKKIEKTCASYPDHMIHGWSGNFGDGTYGRIGLSKQWFLKLRGYDESFEPVGYQDTDLIERARKAGMSFKHIPCGNSLFNTKDDTMRYTGVTKSYDEINTGNMLLSTENIRNDMLVANVGGWAEAMVSINFGPDIIYK